MNSNPFSALSSEGESDSEPPEVSPVDSLQLTQLNTSISTEPPPRTYRPPHLREANEIGLTPTGRARAPVPLPPPPQTVTQAPPSQWPARRELRSYRDQMQGFRPTNTASCNNKQSDYVPGMIIRAMHFEESIPRVDNLTAVDLTVTAVDGVTRTHKVNPKCRYFIIVHCYERLSFTAVPVFANGKVGLRRHTAQEKLGYVPLDYTYENPATRQEGIPEYNRVSHGRLFIEEIAKSPENPYPIDPASVVFFTYPVSFLYAKKVALAGYLTEDSRKLLLDLYYGYLDTKQEGIAPLDLQLTRTREQQHIAEHDRLQAENARLTQQAIEKDATIAQLRAELDQMLTTPRMSPAPRTRSSSERKRTRSRNEHVADESPSKRRS